MAKYQLKYYRLPNDQAPFRKWLLSLSTSARARIRARLDRSEQGNWGDYKHISAEIYELREHFGKGYRIYIVNENKTVILLINAGNKSSQRQNIKKS